MTTNRIQPTSVLSRAPHYSPLGQVPTDLFARVESRLLLQSSVLERIETATTPLFTLTDQYAEIESPLHHFQRRYVHFYPTRLVEQIHQDFQLYNQTNSHQALTIQEYMPTHQRYNDLNVSTDTIIYFNDFFLEQYHVTRIEDNQLIRWSSALADGEYIFVIDEKDRLITSTKGVYKSGRIHHSSLSQGRPVKTAGFLNICDKTVQFENTSGHYKPNQNSLNAVINWLSINRAVFEITEDKQLTSSTFGPFRSFSITLS